MFKLIFIALLCIAHFTSGRVVENSGVKAFIPQLPGSIPIPLNKIHVDDAYYFIFWVGDAFLDGVVTGLDSLTETVTFNCDYNEAHFKVHLPYLMIMGDFNVSATETDETSFEHTWKTVKGPGSFTLNLADGANGFSFEGYGRVVSAETGGLKFDTFYTTPRLSESQITRENLVVESNEILTEPQKDQLISDFLTYFTFQAEDDGTLYLRSLFDKILADYTMAQFIEATGTVCK